VKGSNFRTILRLHSVDRDIRVWYSTDSVRNLLLLVCVLLFAPKANIPHKDPVPYL